MIKLTKNEKKVLNILLKNAKTSDSQIAQKLKISSQAVGKIRRRLEDKVIDSYTIQLKYPKIGIETFAISLSKITEIGLEEGELEIEQKLLQSPNIIQVYRLPNAESTHIILYGFRDISEMDDFFHAPKNKEGLHKFIKSTQLYTFSHNSHIKNDPAQLFNKIIDEMETHPKNGEIREIERFKRRMLE
mgnify:CR=1 FL=1